jgi:hypothetical protein
MGPLRFVRLTGVGVDAKGNIYVASRPGGNGSTILQSYTPDGKLLWQRLCRVWIDCPDIHPDDPDLVYSTTGIIRMNLDAPTGQHWESKAVTVDHRAFKGEYRDKTGGSGSTFLRKLSNGQVYQYIIDMLGKHVYIYRFDPAKHGDIAIPAARVSEHEIWVDLNGDGQETDNEVTKKPKETTVGHWVDEQGTIWNASHGDGIFRYPLKEITPHGVPVYSVENRQHFATPGGMGDLRRVHYFPGRDRALLVNGFTQEHPNVNHHWKRAGKVIRRFDQWAPEQWKVRWQLVPPYEDKSGGNDGDGNIMSMDVAGDYLFISREGGSRQLGVKRGHVDVYRFDDGSYVGWMEPAQEYGHVGIMDITHAIKAFKRANGEYLIFLEDSGKARVLVYRWRP